ncbi:MAG: hypothetical protein ACFBSF_06065 [Leptolyngbyaceae cyanobacterium]
MAPKGKGFTTFVSQPAFNLYGETERKQRFEFDPIAHQAKHD